jgi:F0F1-type ATP synthase epsilon subunit
MLNPELRRYMDSSRLKVILRNAETILFQGEVTSISSTNEKGPFDILGQHENFISLISKSLLLHLPDGTPKDFPVTDGILRVKKNEVLILLGVASSREAQAKL